MTKEVFVILNVLVNFTFQGAIVEGLLDSGESKR